MAGNHETDDHTIHPVTNQEATQHDPRSTETSASGHIAGPASVSGADLPPRTEP